MPLITDKVAVMKSWPTCYACGKAKVSVEHAPPQAFFPKTKDAAGLPLYRKQPLVQVPSCADHNEAKSKDDTYALFHLAGYAYVNECGLRMNERLERIMRRDEKEREGRFKARIAAELGEDPDGVVRGQMDGPRMRMWLANCARAVYFWETFEQLPHKLRVSTVGTDRSTPELEARRLHLEGSLEAAMCDCPVLGMNPECFNYSILHGSDGSITVRMVFYGIIFWATSSESLEVVPNEDS